MSSVPASSASSSQEAQDSEKRARVRANEQECEAASQATTHPQNSTIINDVDSYGVKNLSDTDKLWFRTNAFRLDSSYKWIPLKEYCKNAHSNTPGYYNFPGSAIRKLVGVGV